MKSSLDHNQNNKAVRLVEYLLSLASLRTKLVRDLDDYEQKLWVSSIPNENGCFTQAWGCDEDIDSDIWIEIQSQREPKLPSVPDKCEDWVTRTSLRNKGDLPELMPEITIQVENPNWQEGTNEPEYISQIERLKDYPEVQRTWERYIEEQWFPWMEEHDRWESIHKVYSKLFAIHQEQIRLGEEYELVLGLGLLTWKTPTGHRVHRHLIVANAFLEFEARLGKFTVRPMPDGAIVRTELDMLDIEERPVRAEETAKSLLVNAKDHPWDKDCIEGVLQALVHSISYQGEYDNSLEPKNIRASEKPIVEYAPALILRKRSAKGLTETLKKIKDRIENGGDIPGEFLDIAEIRPRTDANPDNDPGDTSIEFDGEVFFPKPSNEEQLRIVDKIRAASGVLVQGPPGTGKSHTIANLVCHLLATGQRTLITAKTPRALQVLEGLVPVELQPLCINLLGHGLKEKLSLESSVGGILRKNEEWDESQATREREKLEHKLRSIREEKAKIDRRLRAVRESETHQQSIAEGTYRGTAARIAEAVNRDRSTYEWFTDTVPVEGSCPVPESDLRSLLERLRYFTSEKKQELSLAWPEAVPSAERLADLVENETRAIEDETSLTNGADERLADLLSTSSRATIEAILGTLSDFSDTRKHLTASPHAWMHDALSDILGGNSSLWRELLRATRDSISSIETLTQVADDTGISIPESTNVRVLYEDACKLKQHLENGGKLGWWLFRPRAVKERIYIIQTVRVNGRPASTLDDLSVLSDVLRVRLGCERAWGLWVGRSDKTRGPYTLQLHALRAMCDVLENALSLEGLIENCREAIRQCPTISEPVWSDEPLIKSMIASCRLALASHSKRLAVDEIRSVEATVSSVAAKSNAHPVTNDLLQAIHNRDVSSFARAANNVRDLEEERQRLQKVDESLLELQALLPNLTDDLRRTCEEPYWDARLQHIGDAWHWAQARYWIEEYIRQEDVPALAKRAKQIEDEINSVIATLASLHAWSFCFSRLSENHRRHMEAWQQSMRRLGKGTGKHAPRHRREAQQHLNKCREAVPAWVMPLHRIWDTVDPAPGIFDIVIIDEASQCGVEALPLFYLGKKILIVGDDKQISPEEGFINKNDVFQLMEQFLYDFNYKDSFHRDASLFDHGKLRYGTQRITLREHFRCMPEIIRFSNDLCYSDTPLIPLRQYGADRLTPLEHVFVSGGYREGKNNRVVNQPEADAVVEKIVELCGNNRYSDKTIGVVVLQGQAQAGLIEGQLLERLGAEEMERRRLVCGNPYSFQGDERDIMLLSMVAAPNERIGSLTRPADERRFNVAASRARDMMILFHSVTINDLSESCLRRRLLEFFETTKPQEIAGIDKDELERRAVQDNRSVVKPPAPFESWFEVDVALELMRREYEVIPQYEFAGKRIDLVVQEGTRQLAIECDGDVWHGVDHYEADMQRQRQLERCGWEFFRVRESAFYSNKETALRGLWLLLEERGILPGITTKDEVHSIKIDEAEIGEVENGPMRKADKGYQIGISLAKDTRSDSSGPSRRPSEISANEIKKAIIQALSRCPNYSCTIDSLTSRVLKEVGVRTRGKPFSTFRKRVMRGLVTLEGEQRVEKYKAKNMRVKRLN